jgi:hypothetical protein
MPVTTPGLCEDDPLQDRECSYPTRPARIYPVGIMRCIHINKQSLHTLQGVPNWLNTKVILPIFWSDYYMHASGNYKHVKLQHLAQLRGRSE